MTELHTPKANNKSLLKRPLPEYNPPYQNKPPVPSEYEMHKTFGGYINDSDFEFGYTSMVFMANRILSDQRFDKQCRKSAKDRAYIRGK